MPPHIASYTEGSSNYAGIDYMILKNILYRYLRVTTVGSNNTSTTPSNMLLF